MHKLLFISLSIIWPLQPAGEEKFDLLFASDYKSALTYLAANSSSFAQAGKKFGHSSELLSTIVFPELMRYSALKDVLETGALEMAYVEKGTEAADFSIGRFQMKPSFVEDLEIQLSKNDSLKKLYAPVISFKIADARAARKERLKRLQSGTWQLIYLNCFVSLVQMKFPNENFQTASDSIRFYSTAYNSGYHRSSEQILSLEGKKYYPYGTAYNGKQYAYADVADYFYRNTYRKKLHINN
ncbi:MAG: hypothetical protein K0S33_3659 [Bacteroidetes bacterium]|jgi:hypothetical protein|nr:hypothetical protein [Bacteroidota bacterium]